MIESVYWKEDILKYSKQFGAVSKPLRLSERAQVNFEKDIIICFFMIRMLMTSNSLSSETTEYKMQIFHSPCVGKVNNRNFMDIDLYDLEKEKSVSKDVKFVCNQLIHSGLMCAYREQDRNWGGVYACSDFKRNKYVYRIPLLEIVEILKIAGNDYPTTLKMVRKNDKDDFVITTN